MSAPSYNIEINQGADYNIGFLFKEAGVAMSLSDASFVAQIRADTSTKIIIGQFTCVKDAETVGRLVLSMDAEQTSTLDFDAARYDLLMTKGGVKTRMLQGTVTLSKAITK